MKRVIISFLLIISSANIFAQRGDIENLPNFDSHKYHYGFYLGLNRNNFKIGYKPSSFKNANVTSEAAIGFNVGLIGDMRINDNINLRFEPGLISNTKTLTFNHIEGKDNVKVREIGNTYLHLPFILKVSTNRMHNLRPYVLGGISYDYNFSSNATNPNDNSSGEFRQNSNAFLYEVGIGVDFYLPYFKFSPSIRGIFAISNEIKYDDVKPSAWTDPIDFMGTRGIFVHFAFE